MITARSDEQIALDVISRNADYADQFESVVGEPPTSRIPPTSVRLSEPLLKRLDTIAAKQHRKRGNLIAYILWEYVNAEEANVARKQPG